MICTTENVKSQTKKEKAACYEQAAFTYAGNYLLSHTPARAVQSAQWGLTSVFGMGTGVTPTVLSPTSCSRLPVHPTDRVTTRWLSHAKMQILRFAPQLLIGAHSG